MKLYVVHCGFYDSRVNHGSYESHTNFLIAAEDPADARAKAKAKPEFRRLKMHVDGLQEIVAVDGHEVELSIKNSFGGKTVMRQQKYGSRKMTLVESDL